MRSRRSVQGSAAREERSLEHVNVGACSTVRQAVDPGAGTMQVRSFCLEGKVVQQ